MPHLLRPPRTEQEAIPLACLRCKDPISMEPDQHGQVRISGLGVRPIDLQMCADCLASYSFLTGFFLAGGELHMDGIVIKGPKERTTKT